MNTRALVDRPQCGPLWRLSTADDLTQQLHFTPGHITSKELSY